MNARFYQKINLSNVWHIVQRLNKPALRIWNATF